MADIFLSYAREDAARARRLAQAFESRGWSVWWDRHIPHGQDFTAHIQQQLDEARCIVVLWSKTAVKSSFVRDEAAEGLNDGRLVPLLLEAVKQPLGFRQFHAADLTDWTGQAAHDEFDRLVQSITAIVRSRTSATRREAPTDTSAPPPAPSAQSLASVVFKYDVYLSYAHPDNIELVEGRDGWVTELRRALEVRLSQVAGRPATVLMLPRLTGNEPLANDLVEGIRQSACFVAVVSPRYAKSDWMRRELTEFERAATEQGGMTVGDRSRLFKVVKTPVPVASTPPVLQAHIGYEFFRTDPDTRRVRELHTFFGADAERDFWLKLDDLAHDITAVLQDLRVAEPEQGN